MRSLFILGSLTLFCWTAKSQYIFGLGNRGFESHNIESNDQVILNPALSEIGRITGTKNSVFDHSRWQYIVNVVFTNQDQRILIINIWNGQISKEIDIPYFSLGNPVLFEGKIYGIGNRGFEVLDLQNGSIELLNDNITYNGNFQTAHTVDILNREFLLYKNGSLNRRDSLIRISFDEPYTITKQSYDHIPLTMVVFYNNHLYGLNYQGFIQRNIETGSAEILNSNFPSFDQNQEATPPPTIDYDRNAYVYYKRDTDVDSLISLSFIDGRIELAKEVESAVKNPEYTNSVPEIILGIESKEDIKIYPNPTKSNLIIESTEFIRTVRIISQAGKVVYQKDLKYNSKDLKIDLPPSLEGLYFVEVVDSHSHEQTRKLLIKTHNNH